MTKYSSSMLVACVLQTNCNNKIIESELQMNNESQNPGSFTCMITTQEKLIK